MNLSALNEKIRKKQEAIEENKTFIARHTKAKQSLQERNIEKKRIEQKLEKEKEDVDALNGLSFANFWHSLINDKTERLHEEEKDVLKIKQELDRINSEIASEEEEIRQVEKKMQPSEQMEEEYQGLLQEKKVRIQESKKEVWKEIETIEKQVEDLLHEMKEIGEALREGENALIQSQDILQSLKSAANWGTYDMLGGGMLATMAKRSHMDEAQKKIYTFQNTLRRYNQELKDVGDAYLPEFENNGFLRFADWFFDGFFVDWSVQSEINQAREQINQTYEAIKNLQNQLKQRFDSCEKQMQDRIAQEEMLILNVKE